MFEAIFIFNKYGKIKFSKIYSEINESNSLGTEIYNEIYNQNLSNIVFDFKSNKSIAFRHFGNLTIALLVDESESELAVLDIINVIVLTMEDVLKGLSELKISTNLEKIYYIVDEIISGGIVIETDKVEIIKNYNEKIKN